MPCLSRLLLLVTCVVACATPPPPPPEKTPAPQPAPTPKSTLLEGVVRGAAGEPVSNALVALVPATQEWSPLRAPPAARVRTSADGRFRIERVPAGPYALNVTAPGLLTVFRTGLKLEEGQQLQDQEVRMEARGAILRGTVRQRTGAPASESWVVVGRVSDEMGDCAYVQADKEGAWSVQLEPDQYTLYTEAAGYEGTAFPAQLSEGDALTQDVYVDPQVTDTVPSAEVVELLKKAAVPLSTVEAGHGFEDLRPLAPWLEKARVVALGEATHGTREFFQLKHRMLEWLATEHGFTLFGIEANFAEALAVNDYVLTGKGDPGAALAGMYFWTWDTEEVLALIRWMRAWNADPKHTRKLKFYGFDMQFSPGSTKALLEYLRKVDPALLAQVEKPLQPLLAKNTLLGEKPTAEALASWQTPLAELQKRLAERHAAYAKKSSEREWRFAVRHADLLAYLVDISGHPRDRYISRDRIMAENLRWLLEQEGPDAKMVAWAHNGHVSTGNALPFIPMGRHLRQALGDALFVFGLTFNQGSFQAMDGGQPPRGLIAHTLPPARPGTLDAVLASAGQPLYALDVRDTPRDSLLGALFRETRHSRQIGAVYASSYTDDSLTPAEEFDGVFFVDTSHPATATPTGRRPPPPQAPKPSP